jgi:hypothetical protein
MLITFQKIQAYEDAIYDGFRQCHDLVYNRFTLCSEDNQCPQGVPCDLVTHQCAPSSSSQDIAFYDCVYNGISFGIWIALQQQLGIASNATGQQIYEAIFKHYQSNDCVGATGTNAPWRTYTQLDWGPGVSCSYMGYNGYMGYYGLGIEDCTDHSCDPGPTSMLAICHPRTWVWIIQLSKVC